MPSSDKKCAAKSLQHISLILMPLKTKTKISIMSNTKNFILRNLQENLFDKSKEFYFSKMSGSLRMTDSLAEITSIKPFASDEFTVLIPPTINDIYSTDDLHNWPPLALVLLRLLNCDY